MMTKKSMSAEARHRMAGEQASPGGEGERHAAEREDGQSSRSCRSSREQRLARWMEQKKPLEDAKREQDFDIILAIAASSHEAIQCLEDALGDVPFESLLETEELAKGRVARQLREILGSR